MRVLIATVQEPFARGGAEILAEDLRDSLIDAGHEVEIVALPFEGYPTDHLMQNLMAFRLVNLTGSQDAPIDRVIALKFPAYLIKHPCKIIWLIHQFRGAYELWDQEYGLSNQPAGMHAREVVHRVDRSACLEARHVFTISGNVSARLRRSINCESTPLYPPPRNASRFYCAEDEGYFIFPSRIVPLKRQHLIVEALAQTQHPVRLVFTGAKENEAYAARLETLAEHLGVASRIEWRGVVSEADLISGFAHCRGVVFPPIDEDYGYVSLEAMLASKPVITCNDSGGTLEFVHERETGLVTDPNAASLAVAMDKLWAEPDRARSWGQAGRRRYEEMHIGWPNVLEGLLK